MEKGAERGRGICRGPCEYPGPIAAANFDWYQWTGGRIGTELLQ